MKIGIVQTNPIIGNFSANVQAILTWTEKARTRGCDLVIFPEMSVCGYPPQDLLERRAFLRDHDRAIRQLVSGVQGISLIAGVITPHTETVGKPLHNSALLIADGEILFSTSKRLLPNYDVFDEQRYFEPGSIIGTCRHKGIHFALTICEDIWNDKDIFLHQLYAADPVSELLENRREKVDMLINIAASPFSLGKNHLKHQIFINICRKYRLPLIYCNQTGGQDCLLFDGQSLVMDGSGEIIARAAKFREDMLVIDYQPSANILQAVPETSSLQPAEEDDDIADLFAALVMGVRDYVTKCGFTKGLIGLSGGIDSALTAAIAVHALGAENVMGVALPSPYTSEASTVDARELAQNLKIAFTSIPISAIFSIFQQTLEPFFTGMAADVTEQNIQARIRGNLLMALSNKYGHMLLTTGNKSEMAVGYCTLYGDMSGGLAVISDVPKQMVYALARYLNRNGEVIPRRTIDRPPSAELAPDQLDQDDLPPYEILDPILQGYLEDNLTVDEIAFQENVAPELVRDIVRRIRINEYKRKQAPPGLKVTTKAFGYGRRYPTAQQFIE